MQTLTSTIKNLRNKVMRTAWHLFRKTGLSFAECLKNDWKIIKEAVSKVDTHKGRCFLENGKNVYRMIARDAKTVNKEIISQIVRITELVIRRAEFKKKRRGNGKASH